MIRRPFPVESPPHPPLLERGYLDLACGCRVYLRAKQEGGWHRGMIYLCARQFCATGKGFASRIDDALAAGQPLTPRATAWPHPVHGKGPMIEIEEAAS